MSGLKEKIDKAMLSILPFAALAVGIYAGYKVGHLEGMKKQKKLYQPVAESYSFENERLRILNKVYEGVIKECYRTFNEYDRLLDEQRLQEEMEKDFKPNPLPETYEL